MKYTVLTLFPDMVKNALETSIIGRASQKDVLSINAIDIRDFANNKHNRVDDYTYGGGAGMLMQAQPVYDAWKYACDEKTPRTIYLTPQGKPFTQNMAMELAREEELIFLCGHYEGIDERVLDEIVTDRVSIGDYVLTGGELGAMVMIDAISRLVPGVLGNEASADIESFHNHLLEYPQYSRPEVWHDKEVPAVLLSGNRREIEAWRLEQSKARTKAVRPDLYEKYAVCEEILAHLKKKKIALIHLYEAIRRGYGEILYRKVGEEKEESILLYRPDCNMYLMHAADEEAAKDMVKLLPEKDCLLEVSDEFSHELLLAKGVQEYSKVIQGAYTERVHLKKGTNDIRTLSMEHLPYLVENYHSEEQYLRDRVLRGVMWGAFVDDRLVGFVGEHNDGSLGLLFVEKPYRRLGIATDLESYAINYHLDLGYIPYGQIVVGNDPSVKLQGSLGTHLSDHFVYWMGY